MFPTPQERTGRPTLEEKNAIAQFARTAIVPILYDRNDCVDQVATGTLISMGGRHFVVTAMHVFDNLDLEKIAYPDGPTKGQIHTLGTHSLIKPSNNEIDVAVLELQSNETVGRLEHGWRFLTIENVTAPTKRGWFFLLGYPTALARGAGETLNSGFITIYSQRMTTIPLEAHEPINDYIDMFFYLDTSGTTMDGSSADIPRLQGMSGASVWQYSCEESDKLWTPSEAAKIVGVQSAALHGNYFRAVNWVAVGEIFKKIDSQLASIIANRLEGGTAP